MSKLRMIRYYGSQPAAGGILGDIFNIGKSLFKKKAKTTAPAVPSYLAETVATPSMGPSAGVRALLNGGGGGGGYGRRRAKGISGKELSGYRKVARLLHKEGMVSKKARRG